MDIDGLGTMLLMAAQSSAVASGQDNGNRDTEVFIPRTLLMRGAQDKQIGPLCLTPTPPPRTALSFLINKQSFFSVLSIKDLKIVWAKGI